MNTFICRQWMLGCAFAVFLACGPIPAEAQQDVDTEVWRLLNRFEFTPNEDIRQLNKLGTRAFPTYLRILDNAKIAPLYEVQIFLTLNESKEDRTIFLEHAVSRLNSRDFGVRIEAAKLIGQIGTTKDAPPLIAMLNDPQSGVAGTAAASLGKIGGARERLALTIWLKNTDPKKDPETVKDVRVAIEQISKRIDKKK